jgi:hypothetical protein
LQRGERFTADYLCVANEFRDVALNLPNKCIIHTLYRPQSTQPSMSKERIHFHIRDRNERLAVCPDESQVPVASVTIPGVASRTADSRRGAQARERILRISSLTSSGSTPRISILSELSYVPISMVLLRLRCPWPRKFSSGLLIAACFVGWATNRPASLEQRMFGTATQTV